MRAGLRESFARLRDMQARSICGRSLELCVLVIVLFIVYLFVLFSCVSYVSALFLVFHRFVCFAIARALYGLLRETGKEAWVLRLCHPTLLTCCGHGLEDTRVY